MYTVQPTGDVKNNKQTQKIFHHNLQLKAGISYTPLLQVYAGMGMAGIVHLDTQLGMRGQSEHAVI